MVFYSNNISPQASIQFAACSCLSCPCNGKAIGGRSSNTADGASGSQNQAGKQKKLNNPSGCS